MGVGRTDHRWRHRIRSTRDSTQEQRHTGARHHSKPQFDHTAHQAIGGDILLYSQWLLGRGTSVDTSGGLHIHIHVHVVGPHYFHGDLL